MPNNVFPSRHPLVAHKLALLRSITTKPKKFRELVRELAILLCYEATTDLETEPITVTTPMGEAAGQDLRMGIGLVPVLRAGLGMVEGIWEMMPAAEVWHIGLRRDERTLQPMQYYANKPVEPRVQVCLILDPMLATGGSAAATVSLLKEWGVTRIKYIGLIAAPEGIARLHGEHPDVPIHLGAIDSHLNEIGYIVPGLGDAGDRQFGTG
ncbi:MAG: uracil phosphoribosyltransferase [Anaerolineales bacterium]|nr:uracil phosphoribosyltransferase [Anaerolineales bacterium]